jgi:hypothetical protein
MDGFMEGAKNTRRLPSSVEQMKALILSIATGFIDLHQVEDGPLRIFGKSINASVGRFLCYMYKLCLTRLNFLMNPFAV